MPAATLFVYKPVPSDVAVRPPGLIVIVAPEIAAVVDASRTWPVIVPGTANAKSCVVVAADHTTTPATGSAT